MTEETKCSGLKILDPVQGLVDYVNDVKPYHTKVVEILVEYVYNETLDGTITDDLQIDIEGTAPIECGWSHQLFGTSGWGVADVHTYSHEQTIAHNIWTITHNMGTSTTTAIVNAITTGGAPLYPADAPGSPPPYLAYTDLDSNTVILHFAVPVTGTAILKGC